jgi:ATP-dependent exoDNAse (exonuclease V) alpha subunit
MSIDQDRAFDQIMTWTQSGEGQVHGLLGWAGTGKTFLLKRLAEALDDVWVMCYTGKAASVLRNRGFGGATTIHRRLYRPFDPAEEERKGLYKELRATQDEEKRRLLLVRLANLPRIVYNNSNPNVFEEGTPQLIMIDEASMVDTRVGEDLMRLNVPILTVGDPFQLPPVKSVGFFDDMNIPKAHLTENHRTEADDIIELARRIRVDGRLETTGSAASVVDQMPDDWFVGYSQMLCGRHVTRHSYNTQARRRLLNRGPMDPPQVDDCIVRLRNDYPAGLLNGTTWVIRETWSDEETDLIGASVKSLAGDNNETQVYLDPEHFRGQGLDDELFNYGFVLTTHKAQGSEWDTVLVIDESNVFGRGGDRVMPRRWLYTAVTRAVSRVTVVRNASTPPSGRRQDAFAAGFAQFYGGR